MSVSIERVRIGVLPVETWSPPTAEDATFRYVDISSVDRESKSIVGVTELAVRNAPSRARQVLRADDVLVSTVRPNLNAVAIVPEDLDGVIGSTGFTVLRANPRRLLPRFLFYWVRSPAFITDMIKKATGASYPAVSDRTVLDSSMPMPHVDEQRRIVGILDKADAIRHKRNEAIALTEELLRSAFLEAFGDPVANPKGWPRQPLGELASIRRGASPRPIERYMGGSVPWVKIGDATGTSDIYLRSTAEFVTEEGARKSVRLNPGAVIVANSGVSLGFARVLMIEGCIHDGWLAFEDIHERLRKIYLVGLINLLTPYFRRLAPEGTQPNLNTNLMRSHNVPLPPPELQSEYERIVSKLSHATSDVRRAACQAEGLFSSLIQRAFSTNAGKLAC